MDGRECSGSANPQEAQLALQDLEDRFRGWCVSAMLCNTSQMDVMTHLVGPALLQGPHVLVQAAMKAVGNGLPMEVGAAAGVTSALLSAEGAADMFLKQSAIYVPILLRAIAKGTPGGAAPALGTDACFLCVAQSLPCNSQLPVRQGQLRCCRLISTRPTDTITDVSQSHPGP